MIAPDSASTSSPSVSTGALPSGWIARRAGGASRVFGSRRWYSTRYSSPSSSSSQRMRWERELSRWWTVIIRPSEPIARDSASGASVAPPGPVRAGWRMAVDVTGHRIDQLLAARSPAVRRHRLVGDAAAKGRVACALEKRIHRAHAHVEVVGVGVAHVDVDLVGQLWTQRGPLRFEQVAQVEVFLPVPCDIVVDHAGALVPQD